MKPFYTAVVAVLTVALIGGCDQPAARPGPVWVAPPPRPDVPDDDDAGRRREEIDRETRRAEDAVRRQEQEWNRQRDKEDADSARRRAEMWR